MQTSRLMSVTSAFPLLLYVCIVGVWVCWFIPAVPAAAALRCVRACVGVVGLFGPTNYLAFNRAFSFSHQLAFPIRRVPKPTSREADCFAAKSSPIECIASLVDAFCTFTRGNSDSNTVRIAIWVSRKSLKQAFRATLAGAVPGIRDSMMFLLQRCITFIPTSQTPRCEIHGGVPPDCCTLHISRYPRLKP